MHSLGGTPLFDSLVFDGFIGIVARGFIWKQCGDACLASSALLHGWGAEPQEGGGLRAWSEGAQHQCPDEAPGGAEGTVATEQQFCFVLLLILTCHSCQISTIVHSIVLPTIF